MSSAESESMINAEGARAAFLSSSSSLPSVPAAVAFVAEHEDEEEDANGNVFDDEAVAGPEDLAAASVGRTSSRRSKLELAQGSTESSAPHERSDKDDEEVES